MKAATLKRLDHADRVVHETPRSIHAAVLVQAKGWPPKRQLKAVVDRAVRAALAEVGREGSAELSVLFSDDATVRGLNARWRGKDKATNVLSFPAMEIKRGSGPLAPLIGDIVLAAETVAAEASLEGKPLEHHITHLVVHGLLHLLGYDHDREDEAEAMEGIERRVLARLAIPDPYA